MKSRFISLTLFALISGFAVHGALVACGGSPTAEAAPTDCSTWEVKFVQTGYDPPQAPVLDPGWEPFANMATTPSTGLWVRRCKP